MTAEVMSRRAAEGTFKNILRQGHAWSWLLSPSIGLPLPTSSSAETLSGGTFLFGEVDGGVVSGLC